MLKRTIVTLAVGTMGLAASACSTMNDAGSPVDSGTSPLGTKPFCELPRSCQDIAEACMPKDDGTPGPVHTCHKTGMEDGIEANCTKDLESCVATCKAAPALGSGPPLDLFAACRDGGAGDAGPLTFPTTPLTTFTSDGKDLAIELRTAPQQPVVVGPTGEGQLRISDVSTGAPVDGLQIAVTTWMPVMGHPCSPVAISVSPQGGGVYLLTPFLASMKGACEVKLTFSGEKSEHAVSPTFDITE